MDEPLGPLDRALPLGLEEANRRVHHETGITFVYVTHDSEEARTPSDRIVVMRRGRITQIGSADDAVPVRRPAPPAIDELNVASNGPRKG